MITVAVAGGSSPGLGRSILEALKQNPGKLKPIVLGRVGSTTPEWLEELGIEVRRVDYTSTDSLVEALQDVHTVICTLLAKDGTWAETQVKLLKACLKAGVSRFAPAEFGCGPLAAKHVAMLAPQLAVIEACCEAQQQHPDFEYAGFHLGLFMNYLGYGAPNEGDALHGFNDNWTAVWWHVKEMKAEIPLTKEGKVPSVTMTEIRDAGRFVAAACLLDKGAWKEDFSMVGETVQMDEVVRIVEEVRGGKMEVVYRPFEQVVRDREREQDFYRKFWYELEEMNARNNIGEGIVEPRLNKLCPEVKPATVQEYVRKFWS